MEDSNSNFTNGQYSILIGKGIFNAENYKLIIQAVNPLEPEQKINIEDTITFREHHLITSALRAMEYLRLEKELENKK